MKQTTWIAPSILSADFADMGRDVRRMEQAGADLIHCDVMDGLFVPNISFGFKMIEDIKRHTRLPLDVHLMIEKPERYLERFIKAGADYLTFHFEAATRPEQALRDVRGAGVKAGLVISPDTPPEVLPPFLPLCDMLLVMSVYPGFGGQSYIPGAADKLAFLRRAIDEGGYDCRLEVDGGIAEQTVGAAKAAGADTLVAGSAVFAARDAGAAIEMLRRA
ncbi:MAG: ribulose-phosphate 3-epimerase [Clostridiales bacterium]|jgi:ribulose-phosphate 3-epimerase|nr:ribulose-phosphate 3-epimerase [Clostridiales bacterium]